MKTLAIVSSYDVSCGNASFTDVLRKTIEATANDWTVTPIGLNLNFTQNLGRLERKTADKQIAAITEELMKYDAVNIQFESGLFGITPHDVLRRVRSILQIRKQISFTFHSPRLIVDFIPHKEAIRLLLRGRLLAAVKSLLDNYRINADVRLNRAIIKILRSKNIPVIVHTLRSQQIIAEMFDFHNVHVHPIKMIDSLDKGEPSMQFLKRMGLPENKKYLGLFGYISKYKGHSEAIASLQHLPEDYVLVVAGRIHPQSLGNPDSSMYLKALIKEISGLKGQRVFFLHELQDEDFVQLIRSVDCCILPYHEVGQDGSGIASLCFDEGKAVVASYSRAFDELFKLVPEYETLRFDIENPIQIAQQITRACSEFFQHSGKGRTKFSIESQAGLYVGIFDS